MKNWTRVTPFKTDTQAGQNFRWEHMSLYRVYFFIQQNTTLGPAREMIPYCTCANTPFYSLDLVMCLAFGLDHHLASSEGSGKTAQVQVYCLV